MEPTDSGRLKGWLICQLKPDGEVLAHCIFGLSRPGTVLHSLPGLRRTPSWAGKRQRASLHLQQVGSRPACSARASQGN